MSTCRRSLLPVLTVLLSFAAFTARGTGELHAQTSVHPPAEAPTYGDLAPAVEYARVMLEAMRLERGTPGLSAYRRPP